MHDRDILLQSASQAPSNTPPPRARALIEFIEGDLSRAPIVYPASGSDEIDDALCQEILRRWDRG